MSNTATFNTSPNLKLSKKLSFGEEVANSVTHAVGAIAMLVLLPITAVHANNGYGMTAAVGMSVFVISLFLMFLSSAIYHAMDYNSPHKMVLRIIDHSMIYIAIAGSYTPVALSSSSSNGEQRFLVFSTKSLPKKSMKSSLSSSI